MRGADLVAMGERREPLHVAAEQTRRVRRSLSRRAPEIHGRRATTGQWRWQSWERQTRDAGRSGADNRRVAVSLRAWRAPRAKRTSWPAASRRAGSGVESPTRSSAKLRTACPSRIARQVPQGRQGRGRRTRRTRRVAPVGSDEPAGRRPRPGGRARYRGGAPQTATRPRPTARQGAGGRRRTSSRAVGKVGGAEGPLLQDSAADPVARTRVGGCLREPRGSRAGERISHHHCGVNRPLSHTHPPPLPLLPLLIPLTSCDPYPTPPVPRALPRLRVCPGPLSRSPGSSFATGPGRRRRPRPRRALGRGDRRRRTQRSRQDVHGRGLRGLAPAGRRHRRVLGLGRRDGRGHRPRVGVMLQDGGLPTGARGR